MSYTGLLSKVHEKNSENLAIRKWARGPKTWRDISQEKILRWQISICKDGQEHVIRELQGKATMNSTTHLLEWPKSGTLTTPNTCKDIKQQEFSLIDRENAKWHTLETVWQFFINLKVFLTIWFSSHTHWYLLKGADNVCPHKNLYVDVYSSLISNCQNLGATKMSSRRWWMNNLLDSDKGTVFSHMRHQPWRDLEEQ